MDADGTRVAPLIRTFLDHTGRWILTVLGEDFYQVPDSERVPAATIEILRAMDYCMHFSPEVIRKYNLIELDPTEFETADE